MGKRRNYDSKEYDQLQKLKKENKSLKKQLSALKKQVQRLDLDNYKHIRELIEDEEEEPLPVINEKEAWKCWECNEDVIRLIIFERQDGTFYFRRCQTCGHRTKVQKYNDKVKGIKPENG